MYEMTKPLFRELNEVYDAASPETRTRVCAELEQMVNEGRRKRALDLSDDIPRGSRVSGKVGAAKASKKHTKQRRL